MLTRRTVPCHACLSTDDATFLEANGYRIARCRNCGLWFVNPQPTTEELKQFYATYDEGVVWRGSEEHFNRGVRKAILRVKRPGMVLDVGCGSGNFLRSMKEAGFAPFGIEPSGTGSEYGRETHGVDIYHGMIEDYLAANRGRRFDVITLLNVLEHLTDPAGTLRQLRQVLAPDGIIVIVVPDARFHDLIGRLRRLVGVSDPYSFNDKGFLAAFRVPEHLCAFQPRTITSLLQHCEFRVLITESAPVIFNRGFRTMAKLLLFWMSQTLHYFSFGRILVGYSTLIVAQPAS
jgi:SAM-dependent methyltransferase